VGGDDCQVAFGQEFPGKKGSVLACQAELFVKNGLEFKENDDHILDCAPCLSCHFWSQ
jgi:hypothetical protein